MLARARRVKKAQFGAIMATGASFYSPLMGLKVMASPTPGPSNFAFVISGKAVKKAVERNKLKRRARHVIYKQRAMIKDNFSIVFFLKKENLTMSFIEFEQTLIDLLARAKLIKQHV
jgi:ribonuclease P protein component